MPRPPRLEFPAALYHVTARGNERRAIFRDNQDREEYLSRLAFYRLKFRFQMLSYCLMTNHVHLAIRTGQAPLSRIMAGLHSSYAEWFNRRHDRVGHLFQGRYKAFLVQEDRYLQSLVRYIHRNPVEARVVRRAADYRWSSDRCLRKGRGPDWLDVDPLLGLLEGSRRAAVRRYVALVDGPADVPPYEPSAAVDQAVVGDETFAAKWLETSSETEPPLRGFTLDRLLEVVARDCGLTVGELAGPRRGGEIAAARCLAAYLARRLAGISVRRLARRLRRDDSSFVRPLAQLETRLGTDSGLRDRIERLVTILRQPALTYLPVPEPPRPPDPQLSASTPNSANQD